MLDFSRKAINSRVWLSALALSSGCFACSAQARWFVLPSISYSGDVGWVVACDAVGENNRRERLKIGCEYYFGGQGQAQVSYFVPRQTHEWTLKARFQMLDQHAYSMQNASNQEDIMKAKRRYVELMARHDIIHPRGFFYGFQGWFQHFDFGDFDFSRVQSPEPPLSIYFAEGEEYAASLRVGLEGRDNRYDSRRGTYVLWQLDLGASRSSGQTDGLIRATADLRKYLQLGSDRSVLAVALQGGAIHHHVPYFSRFTLGGANDLRGFPLDRYNGNAYYLLRAELRQIIKDSITVSMDYVRGIIPEFPDITFSMGFALFSEGGDLWREDLGWWGFRQGVGVGLRFYVPPSVVGSLDVARPIDSDHYELYLRLEQSF